MRRPVIVAVDGSSEATDAARVAAGLARRLDRRLILANVEPDPQLFPYGAQRSRELARREATKYGAAVLRGVMAAIREPDARMRILLAGPAQGSVAERLIEVCREEDAALVVVGPRARGPVGEGLLGSVSARLAQIGECPVVVVPPGSAASSSPDWAPTGTIVYGFDGSVAAARAKSLASGLATDLGLPIVPVHVEDRGAPEVSRPRAVHREIDDPASTLAWVAHRESAGLVVVGTRGRGPLSESVAQQLTALSPVPLVIVPPTARLPRLDGPTQRLAVAA